MKLIAICPVRNEDWILGLSLRALLMWCDEVVVGLHACTDGSAAIAREVRLEQKDDRVGIIHFVGSTWTEMAHRQSLLNEARRRGASHIVMVDADEVLTGNLLSGISDGPPLPSMKKRIEMNCTPGTVLQLPWLALPRTLDRYITSGVWGPGQQVSMAFKDQPEAHWSTRNGYDFHHRNPMGIGRAFRAPLKPEQGGLMHLQFLDERRLRAKQCLYLLTETLRWPGRSTPEALNAMYGRAVYESDPAKCETAAVPASWREPYGHLFKYRMEFGPRYQDLVPWQETEVKRLIAEHGREKFAGLDLFSVV